jgi:hypothetical protein
MMPPPNTPTGKHGRGRGARGWASFYGRGRGRTAFRPGQERKGLENEEEETVRKDGRPENAKEISDSDREMEDEDDEEKKMLSGRRKRVATSARKNSAKKSKKFTASSDEEEQEDLEKDGEEHENRKRR